MRRPVIAGNWKMYKTIAEAVTFVRDLAPAVRGVTHCEIVVAPPFTALRAAADAARGSNIAISAQDVHWDKEGAHTGDISPGMLLDAGCSHTIIGHSERRHDHGESDHDVNRKLKAALASGLVPIVCVGETLEEREAGQMSEVLQRQFTEGLVGLTGPEFCRIILAYEPVWAIGTGRTATPAMAAESHGQIRQFAGTRFGDVAADQVRILYGGSVKPDNIGGLMAEPDIDGALVGGASLKLDSFTAIVKYPRS
jgi:triosephosphate isomerase